MNFFEDNLIIMIFNFFHFAILCFGDNSIIYAINNDTESLRWSNFYDGVGQWERDPRRHKNRYDRDPRGSITWYRKKFKRVNCLIFDLKCQPIRIKFYEFEVN